MNTRTTEDVPAVLASCTCDAEWFVQELKDSLDVRWSEDMCSSA